MGGTGTWLHSSSEGHRGTTHGPHAQREGLGWWWGGAGGEGQLHGWGGHPPARLSRRECPGHPGARDHPRSPGQGCHPVGSGGTRQGLGPALPAAHGRALPSQVPLEANLRSPKPQLLPQWGYGAGSCPSGNQPCSTLGDQGTQTSSAPGAGRGCRVARFTHPSLLRSRELGKALEENPGVTQGSPAGGHWGNRGARSPTFCTPRVLSTLCSSLHRPLHRTNPSPSPGTPSRAGRTSRTSIPRACPERAQPCKRLLLCTTAT